VTGSSGIPNNRAGKRSFALYAQKDFKIGQLCPFR
jgi:hypothetical protein